MSETGKENKGLSNRAAGLLALVAGSVLAYLCVYMPYSQMASGAESVSVSLKGILLIPLLIGFGLGHGVIGGPAEKVLGDYQKPSVLGWVAVVVLVGLGGLLYWWLNNQLALHGYT